MNMDDVYKKIENKGIQVFAHDIPDIKAVTIEMDNEYGIFMNHKEIKDSDEEFMVATHEYGHCVSGSTHKLNSKFDTIRRHEYRANRRAVLDFLPIERLKKAIKDGCKMKWEFAEYLELPEAFISIAFDHYRAMQLI